MPTKWMTADHLRGGSVTVARASSILGTPGVDGLFIGRMALDAITFATIARTIV
jgi:triosephosphate isomerase